MSMDIGLLKNAKKKKNFHVGYPLTGTQQNEGIGQLCHTPVAQTEFPRIFCPHVFVVFSIFNEINIQ